MLRSCKERSAWDIIFRSHNLGPKTQSKSKGPIRNGASSLRTEDAARTFSLYDNVEIATARKLATALQKFALIPVVEKRGRTLSDLEAIYSLVKDLE